MTKITNFNYITNFSLIARKNFQRRSAEDQLAFRHACIHGIALAAFVDKKNPFYSAKKNFQNTIKLNL